VKAHERDAGARTTPDRVAKDLAAVVAAAASGSVETTLENGPRLLFRHIRPEDKPRLREGMRRLTPETRYRRFFRHIDHLSERQLVYLTEVDFENHFAWLVTLPDEPREPAVAVGRWVRLDAEPDVAEGAVTVADEFHGRGIGKTLLWLLAHSAIEHDVRAFRAWTLGENEPMLGMLRDLGAKPGKWEAGVMEVTVPLPERIEDLAETPAPLVLRAAAQGAVDAHANPRQIAGTRLTPSDRRDARTFRPRSDVRTIDPYRFRPTPKFNGHEVAAVAGMELETSNRIWGALGFPDIDDSIVEFDDRDAEALTALQAFLDAGIPLEDFLSVARVYGQALSRMADAETRIFRKHFIDPLLRDGVAPEDIVERVDQVVPALLDLTGVPLEVGHRRHLARAAQTLSLAGAEDATEELAVGFVDLVGFTRLSDDLDVDDFGGLITRFEDIATTRCSDLGVKMVKIIGDAVMFVSPEPVDVLETGLAIVRDADSDPVLPEARGGLSAGATLPVAGDYFGRPVNVASRLTGLARPGTVVISQEFRDALPEGYASVRPLGPRRLKGIGNVRLFKVRATKPELEGVGRGKDDASE
jgi:adenylate cyclase